MTACLAGIVGVRSRPAAAPIGWRSRPRVVALCSSDAVAVSAIPVAAIGIPADVWMAATRYRLLRLGTPNNAFIHCPDFFFSFSPHLAIHV